MKFIEVQKTQYPISDLIDWQRNGKMELSPDFQRRSVWKKGAKSYLIDSILRGYPIPIIFIRAKTDPDTLSSVKEVVDGQQRLRTVFSFVDKSLLDDFDEATDAFSISKAHNEDLAGFGFNDLSRTEKQNLLSYQFSVHTLPSSVSDDEVLQIFSRMNSTGMKLNAQELRNAEFFGEFKTSVYTTALMQLDRWKKWKVFSDTDISRMTEVEFVTDVFGLILKGVKGKTKGFLDGLYEEYDQQFEKKGVVESRFNQVMDAIENGISLNISGLPFSNKNVFFVLFGIVYDKMYGLESALRKIPAKKIPKNFWEELEGKADIFEKNKDSEDYSTRRLGTEKARKYYFKYFLK
jgi:hypothetical protein